jgi:hypothetical protein
MAIGGVALILMILSVCHLATGIQAVTHSALWEATALAIGIDAGFVAVELALLVVGERVRRQIMPFAKPTVYITLCGSALLNSYSFAGQADSYPMAAAGVAFGLAVPGLVYLFTQISGRLLRDVHSRH